MTKHTIKEIKDEIKCESLGNNYYRIPGLKNKKTNIEGIYYDSPSDIISIDSITDNNGVEFELNEMRLDQFSIKPKDDVEISEPIKVSGVKYLPPFIFVLLNQNLSKADVQAVVEVQGDGVVTFPYSCDVSNDDILTALAGSYVQKDVISRADFETDTLNSYFVYDVIQCSGIVDGEEVDYIENEDFILTGTNKIKWISDREPDIGETYSISYHVLPTYKVVKEIPQLRTSENQRFPKKAVVKLFTTYNENRGVNKQINRPGIKGSRWWKELILKYL